MSVQLPRVTVASRITRELNETLEDYSRQVGSRKSEIIEAAITQFLEKKTADSRRKEDSGADRRSSMGNYSPIYTLSDGQRRTLLLLEEIAAATSKDEEEKKDHEKAEEVLTQGYVSEYEEVLPSIFSELTPDMTNEAHNIMSMFQDLLWSYKELPASDKEKISDQNRRLLHCTGFDFNDPYEYRIFDYLKYLRKDNRWTNVYDDMIKNSDNGNSHSPRIDTYRQMLKKYTSLEQGRRTNSETFTVEEILQIVDPFPVQNRVAFI